LVQRLVDDVDQFACDSNQAVSMGQPEAISELKRVTIERALAYYDELGAGRRPVDITAALAVLVDFVRGIEMLAHAVLAGSDSQYIVRLSTATGGPRYRNDPPRRARHTSSRAARSLRQVHADEDDEDSQSESTNGRIPLARQSTPYCAYTPARMMFPHVSPSHAAEGATSAQIANIWRTTAVSVENLLERSIADLRARLDDLGYGLDSLQDVFAR
jgi:hypothetical protein